MSNNPFLQIKNKLWKGGIFAEEAIDELLEYLKECSVDSMNTYNQEALNLIYTIKNKKIVDSLVEKGALTIISKLLNSSQENIITKASYAFARFCNKSSDATKKLIIKNNIQKNALNALFRFRNNYNIVKVLIISFEFLTKNNSEIQNIISNSDIGNINWIQYLINLISQTQNPIISKRAIICLSNFTNNAELRKKVIAYDGYPVILNACRQIKPLPMAVTILSNLCFSIWKKDLQVDLSQLLNVLQHLILNIDLQVHLEAARSLCILSATTRLKYAIIRHHGIIKTCITAILTSDTNIHHLIITIFANLSESDENKVFLATSGIIPIFIWFFDSNSKNIQYFLAKTFYNLTQTIEANNIILNEDKLELILDYYNASLDNSIKKYVIKIITNIARLNPLTKSTIIKHECIDGIILDCHFNYKKNKNLSIIACQCLEEFGMSKLKNFTKKQLTPFKHLNSLRETTYDTILISKQNIEIPVHKKILGFKSNYFNALLNGNMQESHKKRILINLDFVILEDIINRLYSGKFNKEIPEKLNDSELAEALKACHYYGFNYLSLQYQEIIIVKYLQDDKIDINSAFLLLKLAKFTEAELLEFAVARFILTEFKINNNNIDSQTSIILKKYIQNFVHK